MTLQMSNEVELLKASARGDSLAFEEIIKKYQSLICAITYSATGDLGKGEELAQETFVSAWVNLRQLRDLSKFRAWLISIARNTIRNFFRNKRRDVMSKAASIDEVGEQDELSFKPVETSVTKEQEAFVNQALLKIPPKYREPLVLFYRQSHSIKEISEQLELSEDATRQRIFRGRRFLKEQVAAIVESTISQTGPSKAFTVAVAAAIAGIALTGTETAAAAAAAESAAASSAGAGAGSGISAFTSTIAGKIITAAAAITIAAGAVLIYKQISKERPAPAEQKTSVNAEQIQQETAGQQIASETKSFSETKIVPDITEQKKPAQEAVAETGPVTQKGKSGTYEYFLFTCDDSKRSLFLAKVTPEGLQLRKIDIGTTLNSSAEPLCVKGGVFYAISGSSLYAINLENGTAETLSSTSGGEQYTLINLFYAHDLRDGRLYGISEPNLRVLDLEKKAYRDITTLKEDHSIKHGGVSPDQKYFAYFGNDPNGQMLTIVDTETGKSSKPCKAIKFNVPGISSWFYNPPLVWLDNKNILFIRTEDQNTSKLNDNVNMLAIADIQTGMIKDIAPLPGNPDFDFTPALIQDNLVSGLRIDFESTNISRGRGKKLGRYRLDIEAGKLVEDEAAGGDYTVLSGYLFYGQTELGPAEHKRLKISPDGKFAAWVNEGRLFYYGGKGLTAMEAAQGLSPESILLWLKDEDLKLRTAAADIPSGWKAIADFPRYDPKEWVDNRKPIGDYLEFSVKTDRDTYRLHEPIEVTVTLTNKSAADFNVICPVVYDGAFSRIVDFHLKSPDISSMITCGAEPYGPKEEKAIIKPGESVSATDVLELAKAGDYAIEFTYKGWTQPGGYNPDYKGSIKAEPVNFKVIANDDAKAEQQLFNAKFERLMAKLAREIAIDPNWKYANNTVQHDVIGIPGMGPRAVPYIIEVLKNEQNNTARELLFSALKRIADAEMAVKSGAALDGEILSFFADCILKGEAEQVCPLLFEQYKTIPAESPPSKAILGAFFAGMNHKDANVRKEVCRYLIQIDDRKVAECFKKAIYDSDSEIRLNAGRYLAAGEWLDLDGWFEQAAKEPTYIRYLAAVSIISEIETTFNITQGKLPDLKKEDFSANNEKLRQFSAILLAWKNWTVENQSYASDFFEKYRQKWARPEPGKERLDEKAAREALQR